MFKVPTKKAFPIKINIFCDTASRFVLRLYPFTGGEIFSETTSLNVFGLYLYSCEHAVLLQMQKKAKP